MTAVIDQLYEQVDIHYTAGDALRFKARVNQRDPDDPGPDDNPNRIPYPLAGYVAASEIRTKFKKDAELIATILAEIDEDDEVGNLIWFYLTAEESEKLRGHSSAVWDAQITDGEGDPLTIMGGSVKPKMDSTR